MRKERPSSRTAQSFVSEPGGRGRCLVEVKTGAARLRDEQVTAYVDAARANGFDGVLTISTQITAGVEESPVAGQRREASLYLAVAPLPGGGSSRRRSSNSGTAGSHDPDQEWVLRELDPLPWQRSIRCLRI